MLPFSFSKQLIIVTATLLISVCNLFAQDIGSVTHAKPLTIKGGLQLRGIYYNASGTPASRSPFSYIFSGSPVLSLFGMDVPFNFTISEQGRSFRQPFNQFGLSPQYKWITVHLGYSNVTFSPYTLAGYTMYGGGVELSPGKLKFGVMYGRMARATTLDTATQSLVPFSFSRKAFAGHLGFGTEKSFFDISYLKAKDDDASVPYKTYDSTYNITPAANTVFGVSAKITLFKKFYIQANSAASVYTRDINSPLSLDTVKNSAIKTAKKFAVVNGSTDFTTAGDAGIGYKAKAWGIKVQYTRIDPGFQSMGAYFFNGDIENYTVSPNFRLFKNKLRFNGSLGHQHDNLKGLKQATSAKTIGMANLGVDFTTHLGLDVNYSNFSNNQQPKTIRFADSLKIAQTTKNLSVMPRYVVSNAKVSHVIIAMLNFMNLNDYSNYFAQNAPSRNIDFSQYFVSYTYSVIASQLSMSLKISSTKMQAASGNDNNNGCSVSFTKSFLKSTLLLSGNAGFFADKRDNGNSSVVNFSANSTYTFLKRHSFNLLLYYTNNKPKNVTTVMPGFIETRSELAYSFNF